MTSYYFMNMAGCRMTEQQLENIPCPRFEVLAHVEMKTIQAGVIMGAGVIGPVVSICRGNRDRKSIMETSYQYGKKGAIIGIVAGPILTMAKMWGMEHQGAWDRAHQLRFSSQVFLDRSAALGTLIGVGIAHYKKEPLSKGAIYGLMGGVLTGTIINAVF